MYCAFRASLLTLFHYIFFAKRSKKLFSGIEMYSMMIYQYFILLLLTFLFKTIQGKKDKYNSVSDLSFLGMMNNNLHKLAWNSQ